MLRFAKINLSQTPADEASACVLCGTPSNKPVDGATIAAQLHLYAQSSEKLDGAMFGGFEPFAHPDLVDALAQARAQKIARIGLQTDGGALSAIQNARGCVEAGVRIFEISWLGGSTSSHDALTKKPGLFDAMHQGVVALHRVEQDLNVHFALIAVIRICEHNRREFHAIVQDALQCGVTALRISDPCGVLTELDVTTIYDLAVAQGVAVFGDGVTELESACLYTFDVVDGDALCNS